MLSSFAETHQLLPEGVKAGPVFENCGAYTNADGGWAAASSAIGALLENVKILGGNVITGAQIASLLFEDESSEEQKRVGGVVLEDGTQLFADIVVLAAGSWTTSMPGLPQAVSSRLTECLTASG